MIVDGWLGAGACREITTRKLAVHATMLAIRIHEEEEPVMFCMLNAIARVIRVPAVSPPATLNPKP